MTHIWHSQEMGSKNDSQDLIAGALRLSAHVLTALPRDLPGQLHGRLFTNNSAVIRGFVEQIEAETTWPWLKSAWPSLNPTGGALVQVLAGDAGAVNCLAVTQDSEHVVTGSNDHTLQVWCLETGHREAILEGHSGQIEALVLTGDGRMVSASRDKTLRVWRIDTGLCEWTLSGHTSSVPSVAVTADGRVVSGSYDHTLRIWCLHSGECVAVLSGHTAEVMAIALTDDGRVVSASKDNTLRICVLIAGNAWPS